MTQTCKDDGIGPLSFSHVKCTGISPEVTLQLTCARFPSWRFAEKENGSISGGSTKYKEICAFFYLEMANKQMSLLMITFTYRHQIG